MWHGRTQEGLRLRLWGCLEASEPRGFGALVGPSGGVGWSLVRSHTLAPERGSGFVCVIRNDYRSVLRQIALGHVEQVLSIQSLSARRVHCIHPGYHRI